MATLQVREKIHQLIRFTALAMFVLGLLVTIAPFQIRYHNNKIYFDRETTYDWADWQNGRFSCEINIPKIYDHNWSGFTIIFTSLITLVTYHAKIPKWPPRVKLVSYQREVCTIAVLLTMIASLAVMSQEEGQFGRIRNYNIEYCIYGYNYEKHSNRYHISTMLSWFHVLLISSNIVVVACVLKFVAFFSVWILNVMESSDPEENHSQQQQQQHEQGLSTSERYYLTKTYPQCNCHLGVEVRPGIPPTPYTTRQSEGHVNSLNPHSG